MLDTGFSNISAGAGHLPDMRRLARAYPAGAPHLTLYQLNLPQCLSTLSCVTAVDTSSSTTKTEDWL
ncbi:hypothetical protein BDR04DRAFT_1089002 [Suillus decipiens]|nr:hypothetical protein BDR04DRAFT_1089002 [Suillus decipiens]